MAALERLGNPTIEYIARQRLLRCSEDITPRWAPTPERFREELELLGRLAALNREMNQV